MVHQQPIRTDIPNAPSRRETYYNRASQRHEPPIDPASIDLPRGVQQNAHHSFSSEKAARSIGRAQREEQHGSLLPVSDSSSTVTR